MAAAECTFADLLAPAGDSPDAKLLAACERFLHLDDVCDEEFHRRGPGHMARILATRGERDALQAFIANTKALTSVGRAVKAEVGITLLGGGTWGEIAKSALRDFQSVAGAA